MQNQKNQNSVISFLNDYFNIILAAGLVIFLLVAYFFVLAPKYQVTLAAIKDSISQKQVLYNAQSKKLADLKAISALYKKIDPNDLRKFNSVLSDRYVKESLFGEIEDIINQNGFIVNSISITDLNGVAASSASDSSGAPAPAILPDSGLGEMDINLSLSALDYASFKNLLKVFETNLRLFDVSRVSFSSSGNSADLTLRTYYYQKNAQ